MKRTAYFMIHIAIYYVVWFACIYAAARGEGLVVPLVSIAITLVQILWHATRLTSPGKFIVFVASLTLAGAIIDSVFVNYQLVFYAANIFQRNAPLWIIAIWFNFAVVFYIVGQLFWRKPLLLSSLALLAFPLAYLIGIYLGAASTDTVWSLCVIGLVWAVLLPCLCLVFTRARKK